jgi:hypothetical protein
MYRNPEFELAIENLIDAQGYVYASGVLRGLLARVLRDDGVSVEMKEGVIATLHALTGAPLDTTTTTR